MMGDIEDGLIFIGVCLLIIVFWGEPDISDGIASMAKECEVQNESSN